MNRTTHFELMRETSNIVIPKIRDIYHSECKDKSDLLSEHYMMLGRRLGRSQPLLRPYLVRLGYEIAGGSDWISIASICAAVEIFNISTYQSNTAFDGKNGIINDALKNRQFICSVESFGYAFKTLLSIVHRLQNENLYKVIDAINDVQAQLYWGQFIDLHKLNIANLDFQFPIEDYLKIYLDRCDKLGGQFTSFCLYLGASLADANYHLAKTLKEIGEDFGIAGQIVNDLGDFVPESLDETMNQRYALPFTDAKLGKLTFPLFYAAKRAPQEFQDMLIEIAKFHKVNDTQAITIIKQLLQSNAIQATRKLVNSFYNKLKRRCASLPDNKGRRLLSLAFSTLQTNRYFAFYRRIQGNRPNEMVG